MHKAGLWGLEHRADFALLITLGNYDQIKFVAEIAWS
jgi:hypothetical protein